MAKRMGKALLAALKKEGAPAPEARESVLGNPQRRRVFQYFCLHPCGSLAEGAKALGLSPATVRFHAQRLSAAGYLAASGSAYVPVGLIEGGDVPIFEALSSGSQRRVLAASYASAGTALGELAAAVGMSRQAVTSMLETFESLRLVSRVLDGRFLRMYPTRTLEEKRERHGPRAKHFAESLVARLDAEGESPEVLRLTASELQVRFGRGHAKATLDLPIEPYSSLLL